jgi:hypothetical protein
VSIEHVRSRADGVVPWRISLRDLSIGGGLITSHVVPPPVPGIVIRPECAEQTTSPRGRSDRILEDGSVTWFSQPTGLRSVCDLGCFSQTICAVRVSDIGRWSIGRTSSMYLQDVSTHSIPTGTACKLTDDAMVSE